MTIDDDQRDVLRNLEQAEVDLILARLTPEERRLLSVLVGLGGEDPRSIEDAVHFIGEDLETLQRHQASALRKLANNRAPRRDL